MSSDGNYEREFVRIFFTSSTAISGENSAKMLQSAAQLRRMQAPDTWIPDNEDATAPSMRAEDVQNLIGVVSKHGVDFPNEIHPRVVWHCDDPSIRYEGFKQMLEITDPENGAVEYIDGFVTPEVGDLDDWKKADEFITIIEHEHGLDEGSLSMSVIIESGEAELVMSDLRAEKGKPSNNLERLFLLVDGQVNYTKDMRAVTPAGELPAWVELRHNTSRGAGATGCIAMDGPYDGTHDVEGYRERMVESRAMGMTGIWAFAPGQVVTTNEAPLPPKIGSWLFELDDGEIELDAEDGRQVYNGDELSPEQVDDDSYVLRVDGEEQELDAKGLHEELLDLTTYVPSMDDIVDSVEEFGAAKEAGKGAIAITQATTLVIDGVKADTVKDRIWDRATYQAAMTPVALFQDVYEHRPDQHDVLEEIYGEGIVERAMAVGTDG